MTNLERLEFLKQKPNYTCRFHPKEGFHSIGCDHQDWSKEQLQGALDNAKRALELNIELLNMKEPDRSKPKNCCEKCNYIPLSFQNNYCNNWNCKCHKETLDINALICSEHNLNGCKECFIKIDLPKETPEKCCEKCSNFKGGCYENRTIKNSCPCHTQQEEKCPMAKLVKETFFDKPTQPKPWEDIRKKIKHQIEIEFDSNQGRFSEVFIDAIMLSFEQQKATLKESVMGELPKKRIGCTDCDDPNCDLETNGFNKCLEIVKQNILKAFN